MKTYAILAGLALAAVSVAPAFAQTTTPDPTLTEVFNTDGSTGTLSPATFTSQSKGVGFTPSNDKNAFPASASNATAQTIYNPLIISNTIAGGSSFQIGVHGFANNETSPGNPVTIFTSIFNFDPNAAAGNVPILGPAIINNAPILITSSGTNTTSQDAVYFTGTVTLPQTLASGSEYVIAFAPDTAAGGSAADFALVFGKPFASSGLPSGQAAVFQNNYLVDNNSSNTGGPFTADSPASSPIAYRFYAGAATAAPEPSTTAAFAWGSLAVGLLVWKRRRAA